MRTKLTKEMFRELYAKGVAIAQITETLGICHRTANYWRKALKLPRRRKA
jgi:hypothetical protein